MKTKVQDAKHVAEQLQAGADAIRDRPMFALDSQPTKLEPVVLHAKGMKSAEASIMNRLSVRFGGKKLPIRVAGCGSKPL